MKVTVFGAKGLLGTDLLRQAPANITAIPHDIEINIVDETAVRKTLSQDQPEWVINAAAFSDVDGAEKNPQAAMDVNAQGPAHIAKACREMNIPFVHISTDYVFKGDKPDLYIEDDEPQPTGNYGKTKWMGEKAVQEWGKHYILRTSGLYGTSRPNHATRLLETIQTGQKIKAATDLLCSPTYTADLAGWIYRLLSSKAPYGTYHLCHTGFCSRHEFAMKLCELMGLDGQKYVVPISIDDLHLPAPRPKRACLSMAKWEKCIGKLDSWQDGLSHFLFDQVRHSRENGNPSRKQYFRFPLSRE